MLVLSSTIDQELTDMLQIKRGAKRCVCTAYQAAEVFMTAIYRNPTQSIDAYLLEEQSYQISPQRDLKRRNLRLFVEVAATEKQSRRKDPPHPPGPHACSGASCCVGETFWAHQNAKNLLVAGALPRTPLGELTALPQTP